MSAPAITPSSASVNNNGPMRIRTLYSGDRLVIGSLVVDSAWRTYEADQTHTILTVAASQRVQLQVRASDGTEITTPLGPMALQFWTDLDIGIVETIEPGAPVEAFFTGAPPDLTLNLRIPKGARGIPGQQGDPGQVSIGTVTTLPAGSAAKADIYGPPTGKVLDLSIPQGAKGDPGTPGTTGARPTFKVGTVTTLGPTSQATVAVRTDSSDASGNTYLIDMGIPKGDTGSMTNGSAGGDLTGTFPNPALSAAAKALFEPAGAVATGINGHKADTNDPHGDRAYARSLQGTSQSTLDLKKAVFGDSTRTKKPNNIVYLNTDISYTPGQGDVFAQTNWIKDAACTDPAQMFLSTASGQYSYLMAPVTGRYFAHFHCQIVAGSRLIWATCSMTKDDRNMSSNVIASKSGDGDSNSYLGLDAWNDQVFLNAGQKVYWSIWGDDPYQLKASYQGHRSFVSLRYLGPD